VPPTLYETEEREVERIEPGAAGDGAKGARGEERRGGAARNPRRRESASVLPGSVPVAGGFSCALGGRGRAGEGDDRKEAAFKKPRPLSESGEE
jgi:hypothetical protein